QRLYSFGVSFYFSSYYLFFSKLDVLLRVFEDRRQHYFSDLLNILDTAITVIILLVDVIYIFFDVKFLKDVPRWTRLFRLLRLIILIRVFHLAHLQRQLGKLIRRLVRVLRHDSENILCFRPIADFYAV
uniref:Ion transport domain-containing protein n=1 Tax=Papio anubis TaxID=9555 RepID=A0A8I5NVZ3_PAPAN